MQRQDIGARYRQLVLDRRQLGDARYGSRHVHRTDLAHNRVQEIADAVVYLTLAAQAWAAGQLPANDQLEQRLARLVRDLMRLGELCSQVAQPDGPAAALFAAELRARFAYGESHHGDAYLERENLAEALEEIADCEILVALELERHDALAGGPLGNRSALQEIADRCTAIGELVWALRDAALPDGKSHPAASRATDRRQALLAERESLARLVALTRQYLQRPPAPAGAETASPRPAQARLSSPIPASQPSRARAA